MYQALKLKNPKNIHIPSERTVYRIMKKIGLGIAIILAGILVELSVNGYLAYFSWIVALIGLGFAVWGFAEKDEK